jgi:hypothetical protein
MLQTNINYFMYKLQAFAELLNITVDEVETLKEMDTDEGHHFYAVYMSFQRGIPPTRDFVNKYRKAA